jgi:hypothetical protein
LILAALLAALSAWPAAASEAPEAAAPAEAPAAPAPAAVTPPAAPSPPAAEAPGPASSDARTRESMCLIIESAARDHGLPLEFFARVIWQESRFQADAVGPVTRSGQRAQGIAQFMPGTASERRLLDPFDPVQALPKSAEYLAELQRQFGNLGLAAAAYNAGPRRVQDWLDGRGGMPLETRRYVQAITGSEVESWREAGREARAAPPAKAGCRELMALLTRAPSPFVTQLQQRVRLGADAAWGVQLAAGFSRDKALAMYARAMRNLSAVIGDHDPSLIGNVLRTRGSRMFYQVRIGAETRAAADGLCGRIRKAGQACLVLRNPA